jgi:hypothetical protein
VNRPLCYYVAVPLLLVWSYGCAPVEPTPPEPTRPQPVLRPPPEFRPVAGSENQLKEATLVVEKLVSLPGRLQIRTVTVSPRVALLSVDRETLLEVRSGAVETIINGERQRRFPGDIWLVAPRAKMTVKAVGESAVLQAIDLVR